MPHIKKLSHKKNKKLLNKKTDSIAIFYKLTGQISLEPASIN